MSHISSYYRSIKKLLRWRYLMICIGLVLLTLSCTNENGQSLSNENNGRFHKVNTNKSGIEFSNVLNETDELNYFTYPYLYMGGGVSVGDINNDGLDDLFFTGNMVPNKLYLNKGDFKFEDITEAAGISGDDRWYSGVTMVDINADGYLDIYISVSGKDKSTVNELYVNNQNLTFDESAEKYGIADSGKSVQSTFFDYDKDGDLDLYVANYPITDFSTPNQEYRRLMDEVTLEDSDHFYNNDGNGYFVDVTKKSGLLSFGLSLSATVGDLNDDGWEDIYVSNDFSTPDYLYLNNGDGTFKESLKDATKQTAFYGMGADIADYNNDGLLDIMQVDMAAENNRRAKANMASMNPGLFWSTVDFGMHYQYMYNALQLNRGSKDGIPIFSNTAWMGGVATTDWSWGPLFADFDNDGWKDLFVSNGTRRDINNRDFFLGLKKDLDKASQEELKIEVDNIPSEPIANYIFKNNKDLTFTKSNEEWGIDMVGFSNGVAFADLNNDGQLDLVVNNIDEPAYIYKNNVSYPKNHYIKLNLRQEDTNKYAIGAQVKIVTGSNTQHQHLTLSRGFQSSVAPALHFGLAESMTIDSLMITWPDGTQELTTKLDTDTTLTLTKGTLSRLNSYTTPIAAPQSPPESNNQNSKLFQDKSAVAGLPEHIENDFDDYKFQILLPHKMSQWGPAMSVGDINKDGRDDVYIGGASRSAGSIYIQRSDGAFVLHQAFEDDSLLEDIDATFVDIDNDGDLDLYVVSGGYELPYKIKYYKDRLYLNQDGAFVKFDGLPDVLSSGACVRPFDYDDDGDLDIFVGGRMRPAQYPKPGTSYLLRNDLDQGTLAFADVTLEVMKDVSKIGMVTDAVWMDYNGDEETDLVMVGEWMPITVLLSDGDVYRDSVEELDMADTRGWWFSIASGDLDADGDEDLVLGNLGKNYKYQARETASFDLYVDDFDKNKSADLVLGYYNENKQYPVRGRQCSADQIPGIESKFKNYESFANATLTEIYGKSQIESAEHYQIKDFSSLLMENIGNGQYENTPLPAECQLSSINDILIRDVDDDGHVDILTAGNLYVSEVETPRNDAGIGCFLKGDSQMGFVYKSYVETGLLLNTDVKKLGIANGDKTDYLLVASNNGPMMSFMITE